MGFFDSVGKDGFIISDSKYCIVSGGGNGTTLCQFRNLPINAPMSYIAYNGSLQVSSDERLKENINDIQYENDVYKNILDIETKQFVYKSDSTKQINYGCVAQQLCLNQDLKKILVNKSEEYYSVDYIKINLLLVDCCKKIINENVEMGNKITMLETQLNLMNDKFDKMQNQIQSIFDKLKTFD